MTDRPKPQLLPAIAAGLVAGLVASFAMDRFQAAVAALSDSDSDEEPATERAADGVARAITGRDVPEERKPLAGQGIHYALGAGLGVAYAVAAEYQPEVAIGRGAAFGMGTALALDEIAVPAAGLAEAPWNTAPTTHLYSLASHLVFGTVTDATRRLILKVWRP